MLNPAADRRGSEYGRTGAPKRKRPRSGPIRRWCVRRCARTRGRSRAARRATPDRGVGDAAGKDRLQGRQHAGRAQGGASAYRPIPARSRAPRRADRLHRPHRTPLTMVAVPLAQAILFPIAVLIGTVGQRSLPTRLAQDKLSSRAPCRAPRRRRLYMPHFGVLRRAARRLAMASPNRPRRLHRRHPDLLLVLIRRDRLPGLPADPLELHRQPAHRTDMARPRSAQPHSDRDNVDQPRQQRQT